MKLSQGCFKKGGTDCTRSLLSTFIYRIAKNEPIPTFPRAYKDKSDNNIMTIQLVNS